MAPMSSDCNEGQPPAPSNEARRLVAQEPKRIPAYTIEMDIIEKLKRIYYFASRMANTVSPEAVSETSVEATGSA